MWPCECQFYVAIGAGACLLADFCARVRVYDARHAQRQRRLHDGDASIWMIWQGSISMNNSSSISMLLCHSLLAYFCCMCVFLCEFY